MAKICIIVGHGKSKAGGYDPGATSAGYHEFKIAKEIAKAAKESLVNDYGVECDLLNYDAKYYLSDRIKYANSKNYDFIAEVHLNAGKGTGTEVYYSKNSATGKKYATAISNNIANAFSVKNRGAKTKINSSGTDYFGIIRQTKAEAVLIETLFIDTASDVNHIKDGAGQKKCGEAISAGIAEVLGAKKKAPVTTTTEEIYRIRKTWADVGSQKGAYKSLESAKKACEAGYSVFDSKGQVVYSVKAPTTTTTSTSTSSTLKGGAKLILATISLYSTSVATSTTITKSGIYYIWSDEVVNGKIRITNSIANVGVKGQVSGWIKVDDATKSLANAKTTTVSQPVVKTYKKGDAVYLKDASLYSSAYAKTASSKKKTGVYYIYDGEKINGRYRITNKASNCGKKPVALYVTGFVAL